MKKIYFLMMIFILLLIKPRDVKAVSMDIEYLDILIGDFKLDEKLQFKSDNGFEISPKDDKENSTYIEENEIFLFYNDESIEILDHEDNVLNKISIDGDEIIKGQFYGEDITQVKENKYRDYINFSLKGDKILIINHIKVNNYLYGVLPREVGSSFEFEALKAQAVASKNYAFSNINKHKNDGFDLCSSTHCQVYGGYDGEHEIINRAIDETIDIFITYSGKLINTPYHSNSGGYTQNSEDVWGGSLPYLKGVEDKFSIDTPYSTWDMEMSPLEIEGKLNSNGITIGEILDLEIIEKSQSQRVSKCKIKGSLGEEVISGDKLRSILGNTYFKSATFEVEKKGKESRDYVFAVSGGSNRPFKIDLNNAYIQSGKKIDLSNRSANTRVVSRNSSRDLKIKTQKPLSFIFKGRGYGHGVGMSQWGANQMAKSGYNYKEILKHYYKDIDFLDINKN